MTSSTASADQAVAPAVPHPDPAGSAGPANPRRAWLVLLTMCVGLFLVQLDLTAVNVALPAIRTDLGASVTALEWVVGAYSLAFAGLLLAAGSIGDALGFRRLLLWGLGLFAVGSTCCALAGNPATLVTGRAVQGIGAALLMPATLAVIARTFPQPARRSRALAAWAGISGLALPLGPLVGGVLVDTAGWHAIFWLNLPPLAAGAAATRWLLPGEPARLRGLLHRLDVPGHALSTTALVAATFALVQGPGTGWTTPAVLLAATVTVAAAAGFVIAQHRSTQHRSTQHRSTQRGRAAPMLPLSLFSHRVFRAANGVAVLMTAAMIGSIFPLTLYLQALRHASAVTAGAQLAPMFCTFIATTALTGRLVARVGIRTLVVSGMLLSAAGIALFTQLSTHSGYPVLALALALLGTGIGAATPPMVAAALSALPVAQAGLASGVNNTARQVGPPLGVAVLGGLAGSPTDPGFVSGLHHAALAATVVFGCAALLATRLPGATSRT